MPPSHRRNTTAFSPIHILLVIAAVFFVLFTLVGILIHQNIGTSAYDLGVFDQAYWRYSTFHSTFNTVLGFSILGDHFGVLAFVFGPLYAIYPTVAWPIAAQALSVAAGGVILFYIVRLRLPNAPVVAMAIALSYYINPAVHSTLLWQFHEIGLASGLYMSLILSYLKGNRRLLIISLLALLMCREDMPFTVIAFGVLAVIDKRWRDGAWVIGLAFAWWFFATKVAMPFFNGYGYWQTQPGRPLGVLLDNIFNPSFYLNRFSDPQSVGYLFQVFFPLGFLALLSPRHLIPALPTLLANVLIGSYKTQIAYHYCISIMPFIFWAAVEALNRHQLLLRLSEKRFAILFSSLAVVLTMISYSQYSSLNLQLLPQMVRNWSDNAPTRRLLAELDEEIGDRGVAASDFLLPHLSHRERIYLFPNPWRVHNWGIAGENPHHPNAIDYIVVSSPTRLEKPEIFEYLLENRIFRVVRSELGIDVLKRMEPEAESRSQAIADFQSFLLRPRIGFTEVSVSPNLSTPESEFRVTHFDIGSLQDTVPNEWKHMPDPPVRAPMDLTLGATGKSDFQTAYVRAVVTTNEATGARLSIGSDDGVTVWLNGSQIHENIIARSAVLGDDKLHLQLQKGKNVIVFRVNNAWGAWRLIALIGQDY